MCFHLVVLSLSETKVAFEVVCHLTENNFQWLLFTLFQSIPLVTNQDDSKIYVTRLPME